MNFKAKISHFSHFLPQQKISNDDLSKKLDTSDEWIFTRTGIKNRFIANQAENTFYLAENSAKNIILSSGIKPEELDGIIVSTSTSEQKFPSIACLVQKSIGAKNAFAYDLSAACTGFVYAAINAQAMIQSGMCKKILVIGAEKNSSIVDWSDRATCVLFGDAAAAAIVELSNENESSRIIDSQMYADGNLSDILYTQRSNSDDYIKMKGTEVFKHAVNKMSSMITETLDRNQLIIDDIDWIIPHQANNRIFQSIVKNFNIPDNKIVNYIKDHGNTSSASVPLAFSKHIESGMIKKGQKVILEAIGGGMTWGFILMEF